MPEPVAAIPTGKRVSEVTNDELYQLELAERRLTLAERTITLEQQNINMCRARVNFVVESMQMVSPNQELDDICKSLLKDYIQSSLVTGTS
eukprot:193185-Hanusia_phi.AAC.1